MAPAHMRAGAPPIVLNGRVAARPTVTGVERWAIELSTRLTARRPARYVTLTPPPRASSGAAGHAWEQFALPARAAQLRAPLIFSPANLCPLLWPNNVVLIHDAAPFREPGSYSRLYGSWHRRLGAECARRAVAVLTVSEFSKRELVDLLALRPEAVRVLPGGVGAQFRPDADHERVAAKLGLRRPYVLTVGTADRRKNLIALQEASRRLQRLGIDLVRAGDARPHFAHTDSLPGLRSVGYVDETDLPGLYAGAAAFVLPSLYEGLGLPCLEAMASGVPVVAANRAALPETCGDAALLVDPDDPDAIAHAVGSAVTDEKLRATLRAAGLRRTAGRTWDEASATLDEMLDSLASR